MSNPESNLESNTKVYVKQNVEEHEYKMHKHIYELNIVNTVKIISYDKKTKVMVMEKIDNMNLSDMYGEEDHMIDEYYFDEIRTIIKTLADNHIEYPDITGYNFIEYDNKIWIIDFEHASIFKKNIKSSFVNKFIKGSNKWNPDFK